ncbi:MULTISPECIES: hypothetical protein [unclassified Micromonospora]|uniref:hypothetical protein n=1 Tax=unclassified Micromonospora TaxID=2617518 RepID=UPI00363E658F
MESMRWDNLSAPPDEAGSERAAPAAPPLPLALPGAVAPGDHRQSSVEPAPPPAEQRTRR